MRDFKEVLRPDCALIDNEPHDRYFYLTIKGCLSTH
jgi:hypothetical protein